MRWPVYDHVIFDFDSTLSGIEGIDVLADKAGVGDEVSALTKQAMDGVIDLESVYEQRLSTIRPTRGEIRALKREYRKFLTEDAEQLIDALHHLKHEVYIVSGGLVEPIIEIGVSLGIPKQNIRAVGVEYDEFSGEWWLAQTDEYKKRDQPFLQPGDTELDKTRGKAGVISELLANKLGRSLLVGDGTSDLNASDAVDLFVGYTGVIARDRVVRTAPMVLKCRSLAPIIVIAAGHDVGDRLDQTGHRNLARKAFDLIAAHELYFNDPDLQRAFEQSALFHREQEDRIF